MVRTAIRDLQAPDPALEAAIRARLEEVEEALREAASSEDPLVADPARYLLAAGGKRFRPMLLLLAGHFGDPQEPRLVPGAVAVELTHVATLYHDDVIDEAGFRRGIPSVNARYENTVAVLTGDFLFARASGIAADLGPDVSKLLASTIAKVCEGEIREYEATGRPDVTESDYLEVIRRKTASLIATSCRLGGMLGGASPGVVESLARFGEALGVAFQLSDDIMDLTVDERVLGKEPAADLREGVYTLPVILALRDGERSEELRSLLEPGPPDDERLPRVLELVRTDGALATAREAVSREIRRSLAEAEHLPPATARDALVQFATFIARRCGASI
jgi:heptaprenyl diphosphate synthase